MKKHIYVSLFCIMALLCTSVQAQDANGILYVKITATGNGTGNSWANAIGGLAQALKSATIQNAALGGSVKQIWVAKGTYLPEYPLNAVTTSASTATDRLNTFLLLDNVKMYGGFVGAETAITDRDLSSAANYTMLSGDIGISGDNIDNAYHVVVAAGVSSGTVLDGFTITDGYTSSGSTTYTVNGASVADNSCGGLYIANASPSITNVRVTGNHSYWFGGVSVTGASSPVLTNMLVDNNAYIATETYSLGGGIYIAGSGTPVISNIEIANNSSGYSGGGVFVNNNKARISTLNIHDNSAQIYGGGMFINTTTAMTVADCIISNNTAVNSGGGVYITGTGATLQRCVVQNNVVSAGNGTGGGVYMGAGSIVRACSVLGNSTTSTGGGGGGGIYVTSPNNIVDSCKIWDNKAGFNGGGLYAGSFPTISNCSILRDTAINGGGIYSSNAPYIINDTISSCIASNNGGGAWTNNAPQFTNVLFIGNVAGTTGGGFYNSALNGFTAATFTNVTVSGNKALGSGTVWGAIDGTAAQKIYNSIIYGNSTGVNDITKIANSLIQDVAADASVNLMNTDPGFVNPLSYTSAPFTGGDYRLQNTSPARDAGSLYVYNQATGRLAFDLDNQTRLENDIIDLGAYEFQVPEKITPDASGIVYVKKGSTGNGSSWANAAGELAEALRIATILNETPGTVKQIWVARGTYLPQYPIDAVTVGNNTNTDRLNTFLMLDNVKIYGGFVGTETAIANRDLSSTANYTILSGDIGTPGTNTDNAYHVVVGAGTTTDMVLDGFTITDGYTAIGGVTGHSINGMNIYDNASGGLYLYATAFTVTHVRVTNNVSYSYGGVTVMNFSGSPVLSNMVVDHNTTGNTATSMGAGIYVGGQGAPVLSNIEIHNNTSGYQGGGICLGAYATVSNLNIHHNSAGNSGGGAYIYSATTFSDCIIADNESNTGGGVYLANTSATNVVRCVVQNNKATGYIGGGIYLAGNAVVRACSVLRNSTASTTFGGGAGIYIVSSTAVVDSCKIWDNKAGYFGGGIYTTVSGAITNTSILRDTAVFGGGIYTSNTPDFINDTISGCYAGSNGGGAYITSAAKFTNVLFTGNLAFNTGGALFNSSASLAAVLTNATISGNSTQAGVGTWGGIDGGTSQKIYNSIVYGNSTGVNSSYLSGISSSLIQDVAADATNRIINTDPKFVTPLSYTAAPFTGGDYRLQNSSPSKDAGALHLYDQVSNKPAVDLNNETRVVTDSIDMGAYEVQPVVVTPDAAGILYVKKGSTGNGSSWANAVGEVAEALRAAAVMNNMSAGIVKQIWVATGTYLPRYPAGAATTGVATNTDRNNAFVLVKDTKLYGGFAGNETDTTGRNFTINPTILSGDIAAAGTHGDNVYHVVVAAGEMGQALISGFTVSGAYAESVGTVLVNGVNVSQESGGGIAVKSAALLIEDMILSDNYNSNGAGAAVYAGSGEVKANATFRRVNLLRNSGILSGAGIYATYANVQIEDCAGSYNTVTNNGGVLAFNAYANVYCRQSTFNNNVASGSGGAIYSTSNAVAYFEQSSISENNAASLGGGIFAAGSSVTTFYKCEFSKDTANQYGACFATNTSAGIQFKNTVIKGGVSGYAAGGYLNGASSNVSFVNAQITGNKSTNSADFGTLRKGNGNLRVINTTISGNNKSAIANSGSASSVTILNSIIYGNADGIGGNYSAMYSTIQGATPDPVNHITDADPLFVNGNAPTLVPSAGGSYNLLASSPAFNAGYDSIYNANNDTVTTDLAGSRRIMGSAIDQGAYEIQLTPQTITTLADTAVVYGGNVFTRVLEASSGLTVALSSADNSIAEVYQDAADGNKWKIKAKQAGLVNITIKQAGDNTYAPATDVVFALTVNKAALTVTAKDSTLYYTGSAFTGGNGVSYTGFVNGDDSTTALTGTLAYSGTSQSATSTGTYTIIPSGLTADNYAITYVNGGLTIQLATSATGIMYVKKGSAGSGSSWADATGEVAEALRAAAIMNAANAGTVKQIWVAKGTYLPMYQSTQATTGTAGGSSNNAFVLVKDVKMYGGFAGTESDTTGRDFTNNATVLSGDLGTVGTISDNAYHVVIAAGEMGQSVLSGFTISDGYSGYSGAVAINGVNVPLNVGGGLVVRSASLLVEDVIFSYNYNSFGGGAGFYSGSSDPVVNVTMKRVSFLHNSSASGGAIYAYFANVTLDNTVCQYNTATNTAGACLVGLSANLVARQSSFNDNKAATVGGAVLASGSSGSATFYNCQFLRDSALSASYGGAAIAVSNNAQVVLDRTVMKGCVASGQGGAVEVYSATSASVTLLNSQITGNTSALNGAIDINSGSVNLINSTVAGNTLAGIYSSGSGVVKVYNSIVYGNNSGITGTYSSLYSTIQGATADANSHITNTDPLFVSSPAYTTAPFTGGVYTLQGNSPAFNAGYDSIYTANDTTTTDLAGNRRIVGSAIDQGAYELLLQAQTITALADTAVGYGSVFTRAFAASSGLTVALSSADNSIAEVYQDAADGNKWKIKAKKAGTVNITMQQAGDATYASAADVVFALTVNKVNLIVRANNIVKVYNGVAFAGGNGVTYTSFVNGDDSTSALTGALIYSGNSQGAKNVNNYVITPGGLLADNYNIIYGNGTLVVNKAALTITAKDSTKIYSGVAFNGGNGLSYTGFVSGDDSTNSLTGTVSYSGTSQGAKNVNTYVITPDGLSATNYTITYADGSLTINKAALTVTANSASKVYDGATYLGGNGVSYSGFAAGDDSTVALTGAVTYSGTSQGAKNVNSYVITPGGLSAANYTITYVDDSLYVIKAGLTVTANSASKVYDGAAYVGGNGVFYNGFVTGDDSTTALTGAVTYSGTSQGAKNVSSYVIALGGLSAANYAITYVDDSLYITKAGLTVTANSASKVYDGATYLGGNGVSYSGFAAGDDSTVALTGAVTYSGTSQGAKNVSSYVITPGGLSAANYAITYVDDSLYITKAGLIVTANSANKVYDGATYQGGNGVSYSGFVTGDDSTVALTGAVTYNGTSQGAKNVNSYVITPGGLSAANYIITYVNDSLYITKAGLTVTANSASKVYDGTAYQGGNGISYSGFVAGDDSTAALTGAVTYSGTSQGAKNVNSYVITPGGLSASNYAITYVDDSLYITKAGLTVTANSANKVYDGAVYLGGNGISYSGFVTGDDSTIALTGAVTYNGTSQGAKNVNSYVITPGGLSAANYAITYVDDSLYITKAGLTVTANSVNKVYDGVGYSGGNGVSYSGFVTGDDSTASLSGAITYGGTSQGAKNVNTYVIRPGGLSSANYAITYVDDSLYITKASLTVTANSANKVYDGAAYHGGNGVTYSGFVTGDDSTAALTGAVTYSGTAQGAKNVNSYVITPGGLSAANYAITYVNDSLYITKAGLTVTANSANKVYDGATYQGGNGVTYSGFVTGDDSTAALTGAVTYSGTSQGAKNVNTYVIRPGGLSAANYAITYVDDSLHITKASLAVTANDAGKTYDGIAWQGGNGVSYSGFVTGDDSTAALTGAVTYSGTSQNAVKAGSYVVTPGGLTSSDYAINYVAGKLDIGKAPLMITAADTARCYGIANPGLRFGYTGWVNNETNAVLTALPTAATTAVTQSVAGTYAIVPSGAAADNYAFNYTNGTLTVNALPVSTLSAPQGTILCGTGAQLPVDASGAYSFKWMLNNVALTGNSTGLLTAAAPGTYTAVATDANGCTATAGNSIALTQLLPPQPAFGFESYCADKPVSFTNTSVVSASGVVSYAWNSGNGERSNVFEPEFGYSNAGVYTVTLTATPQACPSLAVAVSKDIDIQQGVAGVKLETAYVPAFESAPIQGRSLSNAGYTWLPAKGLFDSRVVNPLVTVKEDQLYTIEMRFPSGCITVDTLQVAVFVTSTMLVPNVFTPNGDGQNDELLINMRGVKRLNYFRVFNRSGKKLFETADIGRGWDGRYNGELQPLATYVWTAEGVDDKGNIIHRQGSVTLLR